MTPSKYAQLRATFGVAEALTACLQEFCELEGPPDAQWGDRPKQMIRAAARGAMVRVVGRAADFGIEYTKQRRVTVSAGEIVAWEFRERSIGGPHTVDFTVQFVEPTAGPGDEVLIMATERLKRHAGSVAIEKACAHPSIARNDTHTRPLTHSLRSGELIFTFSNEFSWMTNKAARLCVGQWPALRPSQGADDTADPYAQYRTGGSVSSPPVGGATRGSELPPPPQAAVSLLRNMRPQDEAGYVSAPRGDVQDDDALAI